MGLEHRGLRTSRIDRFAVLSAVLLITACSTGGDSMEPQPMTGSISVSVSPTSDAVEQGEATVVTATVTRSGGFSGSVTISVTGAPSGVTATVGTAATMGSATVASVAIEVGPDVDPGVYSITLRASGSGVSTTTATYSLTVTAAPSFQIDLFPTEVSIVQGGEADVALTVFGTNFGAVDLSLEGPDPAPPPVGSSLGPLPEGVTAVFDPNPTMGNSTLTITVGAAVAAGVRNLTVRGTSAGAEDQSVALELTVTDGGGPPPINLPIEMVEIAAGLSHSCVVDGAGKPYCWGTDSFGQVGDDAAIGGFASHPAPAAVAGAHTFSALAAGFRTSCAIDGTGKAYCWGEDDFGALGDGLLVPMQPTPVAVAGGHSFAAIAFGYRAVCALTTAGQPFCWGSDFYGQVGNGAPRLSMAHVPTAVSGDHTFVKISSGGEGSGEHACALDVDGDAYCWGSNMSGELGNGAPNQFHLSPIASAVGHTFTEIAVGGLHTCALGPGGNAYCWGQDDGTVGYEQLGDGPGAMDQSVPVAVSGGHVFTSLTAGGYHTCGITTGDDAYCWGSNSNGQLGDGSVTHRAAPVMVGGGHKWRTLGASFFHTCGVTTAGAAYCWGGDGSQQLGNGNPLGDVSTPTMVLPLP